MEFIKQSFRKIILILGRNYFSDEDDLAEARRKNWIRTKTKEPQSHVKTIIG